MKRSTLLLCALLAACGPGAVPESASDDAASDSALDVLTEPAAEQPPAAGPGVTRSVNDRLEQAQKDEAARAEEAARQVREAEGTAPPP